MLEDPKFVPMARPYASYTPIFIFIFIYIYIHVRLASPTDYRPWKMNCKLRTAEGGLQSNGNRIASLRSSQGFGLVANLQFIFD